MTEARRAKKGGALAKMKGNKTTAIKKGRRRAPYRHFPASPDTTGHNGQWTGALFAGLRSLFFGKPIPKPFAIPLCGLPATFALPEHTGRLVGGNRPRIRGPRAKSPRTTSIFPGWLQCACGMCYCVGTCAGLARHTKNSLYALLRQNPRNRAPRPPGSLKAGGLGARNRKTGYRHDQDDSS